ncbi:MAG: spore coat U domain-containing protein [Gallionella sp.]|nr:spore coat U domain-containing protein [Gallionella sp.]MDD4945801.1 spore coat U domain-containing protein [Gallionella sp.]MDD5612806.1 spore coat U domain-containing protein [Gallionella sp.]
MKKIFSRTLVATSLLLSAGVALAGPSPQTTTFGVTATVANNCTISSAAAIAFGAYDATSGAAATGSGSVVVRCTKGTAITVALDQGLNAGVGSTCTAPARQMTAGGVDRLGYALYSDAAMTAVWGCTAGTNTVGSTSVSAATLMTLPVYASVPASQDVSAGSYADTVTVNITF